MKQILYVATEALPFASSGGLGDVIGSLPPAVKRSHPDDDIRVVMPLYSAVGEKFREKMTRVCEFTVDLAWRRQYAGVYSYCKDGVIYYFIDNEYYFNRPSLYGSFDDGERFAYFCSAVLQMMNKLDYFPDILHANDWQTALCVIYLKTTYSVLERYAGIKTVFSIHNILYQGQYSFDILGDIFALDEKYKSIVDYNGCINLMKGAMVCCDRLCTVSEKYAEEIKTPYYAHGLEHITNACSDKLSGILNGIDLEYYDPSKDACLARNYTWRSIKRKGENKRELCSRLGLPYPERPMISMITRLTDQKGLDLVTAVIDEILSDDVSFVVLGTGDSAYEEFFRDLQRRHPDKVASVIAFDKELSKQIYASSDIFLMPSKTEPCGLSQMIASRYGAVPVVRETGGLYDSIKPYVKNGDTFDGNGFTFSNYNAHDMMYTVRLALSLYAQGEEWYKLARRAMRTDFSWDASAVKYIDLYNNL